VGMGRRRVMTNEDRAALIDAIAEGVKRGLAGVKLIEETLHPTGSYTRTRELARFNIPAIGEGVHPKPKRKAVKVKGK